MSVWPFGKENVGNDQPVELHREMRLRTIVLSGWLTSIGESNVPARATRADAAAAGRDAPARTSGFTKNTCRRTGRRHDSIKMAAGVKSVTARAGGLVSGTRPRPRSRGGPAARGCE